MVFGAATLDDPVSGVGDLATKLRRACGIYIESPQFKLAGIAPAGLGTKPRLRVCNTPDCSYQEMCVALRPSVDKFRRRNPTCFVGTIRST